VLGTQISYLQKPSDQKFDFKYSFLKSW